MTQNETAKKMKEIRDRQYGLQRKIVEAARPVIAVLLDAGRQNSAKELQQLFFELEAVEQEMHAFFLSNPEGIIEIMARLIEGDK